MCGRTIRKSSQRNVPRLIHLSTPPHSTHRERRLSCRVLPTLRWFARLGLHKPWSEALHPHPTSSTPAKCQLDLLPSLTSLDDDALIARKRLELTSNPLSLLPPQSGDRRSPTTRVERHSHSPRSPFGVCGWRSVKGLKARQDDKSRSVVQPPRAR